ncbi:MAG TPA: FAD:protein FMN transferase [Burkholderiaceae bacterium]|nr:FAD:protein FMN transferase [Burkholderiaceae bacterium]
MTLDFGVVRHYRAAPPAVLSIGGQTMGTHWQLRVAGVAAERLPGLQASVESLFACIIAQMSQWRPDSWLSRYNDSGAGSWHPLPPDAERVLSTALELARETGGAFDPALGAVVELWGFGAAERRHEPPEAEAIASARACSGWRRLRIDRPGASADRLLAGQQCDPDTRFALPAARLFQPGGLRLDLSGIAKGHAVDRMADLLQAAGIADCLAEIGGEWTARGRRPDGSPWRIGIEGLLVDVNGRHPGVPLLDASIATSGDDWHGFAHGGRRYGHTIDPRSGWPASERLASVSVVDHSCMRADALATALSVMGPERGLEFAEQRGVAALFLCRDAEGGGHRARRVVMSTVFERLLAGHRLPASSQMSDGKEPNHGKDSTDGCRSSGNGPGR